MRSGTSWYGDELSKLSIEMIEKEVPTKAPIASLLVFPKAETLLIPRPLGHFKCVALLRLVDGTIWMLTTSGVGWTPSRLDVAATVLSGISAEAYSKASVEALLRNELGIPSISLEQLEIDSLDICQWGIQAVAFALNKRLATTRSSKAGRLPNVEFRLSSIEEALIEGLDEALGDFFQDVDSNARKIATESGRFNLRIYNYLAYATYRRYRQQFAHSFPSLLLTSVLAESGSLGEELRSIVDSGTPLVKSLARHWNVRSGVIKHLVGKASDQIGIQWSRDAKGLALALNALHPQDIPGDNADEWSEFNHMVAVGQRLFCRQIWTSSAGLKWLRECVSRTRRGTARALSIWLPEWAEATNIVRFRDAITASLRREVSCSRSLGTAEPIATLINAVDEIMLSLAGEGLADIASQFEDAVERRRAESQTEKVASGNMMLPLIPEDFITSDRSRIVRCLVTAPQLRRHGFELKNCLRSGYATRYVRQGSLGTVFIVGTFCPGSGDALSTAEIAVTLHTRKLTYKFVIKQHTALANRRPSPRCKRAIQELLSYCESEEIRDYLADSWRELGNRISAGRRKNELEISMVATRAVKEILGERLYNNAVNRLRP